MLQFRPQTVGVDVNPRTVAWCQSLGLDARLMQPDMLPFPDVTFDGILLDNVLEHLKEPRSILAEMRRVLKPSGGLLIGVPGRRGFSSDPDHKVFYTEEALVRLLTAAGFQQEKLFFMPFKSAWLERRMRQYCLYGFFRRI
jgi:SAM-dependent methyltransferase